MNWQSFSDRRDLVISSSGGWTIGGEATLHGYNIHQELIHHASWMQSMILSVTGRQYPENVAQFIEAMFVATGYPDPRLWCNRIVSFAGTARCPAAGAISAGIASAEGKVYGGQSEYFAAKFLDSAHTIHMEQGKVPLERFVKQYVQNKRVVYGYGRPLTKVEERIAPMERVAEKLGIVQGEYLLTAWQVEKQLKRWRMVMNYGGYVAARLMDFNFSAKEIHQLLITIFYIGLQPCYIEAFEKEPGTFLPIACEDILYEGLEERDVPV